MRSTFLALMATVALTCGGTASAQGSKKDLGGGCTNRSTPAVSGSLKVGSTMSIDSIGCFTGQGGFGLLILGATLPVKARIPIPLRSSRAGVEKCLLVVRPDALAPALSNQTPIRIAIPNDARLRGVRFALQTFCIENGFAGRFEILTRGLEITLG